MPRLSSLARPENDAEMIQFLQEQNQAPNPYTQPMNTIRVGSGEYLSPEGRQEQPYQFQSARQINLNGRPALLDNQGNIEVETDQGKMFTTMAQVQQNAAEQRYRQQIADMPRQKQIADIEKTQAETIKLGRDAETGGGAKAPSAYRYTQSGDLEPIPGGPADFKAQMAAQQKSAATEQAAITSQQVLDQTEKLLNHPGRKSGTGASSWMSSIPGTDAKGFAAQLETFKAQTFIPMVSALKGMGALSDAEGKKLSASVGALDQQMPEDEFESSLKDVMKTLYAKARASGLNVSSSLYSDEDIGRGTPSAGGQGRQSATTSTAPKAGAIQDGHIFMGGNPADPARWRKQ